MAQSTNAWNEIFEKQGRVFTEPHEDMRGIMQLLKGRDAKTVLDLGSGTGRHVVYLAGNGFQVYGLDNSPEGIKLNRRWLAEANLDADLRWGSMAERLPYQDSFFDALVSVQVIHHADIATIKGIVQEITRVVKQGGFLFITVPKLKNQAKTYEQIEPNTFVPLDGPEKGLPHHLFTPEELRQVFSAFDITDTHLDAVNHYCLTGFRR